MSAAPDACAVCGKPKVARFAPFCSRRCADVDLGRWLKGGYAIPGAQAEEDEPAKAPAPSEEEPED